VNPARRIVDSATAPVTAPAMKECHWKPVKNCRQGGPLWRGQQGRRTKLRISPADTGGRDADLMAADTPTDPAAQVSLSSEPADAPVVCLPQADESTMSADTPEDVPAAPEDLSVPLEGIPAMADTSDGVADTSDNVADFSDGVADTPDDGAESQEDGQVDFGLPLSALQAGANKEDQLKEDAATTTGR
jgi:hypothetical protein